MIYSMTSLPAMVDEMISAFREFVQHSMLAFREFVAQSQLLHPLRCYFYHKATPTVNILAEFPRGGGGGGG